MMTPIKRRPTVEDARASFERAAAAVRCELAGCPPGVLAFFARTFSPAPRSARSLAGVLDVNPSTLNAWFARAALPSPRLYVVNARLVVAADLMGRLDASTAAVTEVVEYSYPQCFVRTVRRMTGLTVRDFRAQLGGEHMLTRYLETLVRPHLEALRGLTHLDVAVTKAA